jgi:hypothetical protein
MVELLIFIVADSSMSDPAIVKILPITIAEREYICNTYLQGQRNLVNARSPACRGSPWGYRS